MELFERLLAGRARRKAPASCRVIAHGKPADLKRRIAELVCRVRIADADVRARAMAELAWAPHVSDADGAIRLHLEDMVDLQRAVAVLAGLGITADEIDVRRPSPR